LRDRFKCFREFAGAGCAFGCGLWIFAADVAAREYFGGEQRFQCERGDALQRDGRPGLEVDGKPNKRERENHAAKPVDAEGSWACVVKALRLYSFGLVTFFKRNAVSDERLWLFSAVFLRRRRCFTRCSRRRARSSDISSSWGRI
jgi:hypothetical protein